MSELEAMAVGLVAELRKLENADLLQAFQGETEPMYFKWPSRPESGYEDAWLEIVSRLGIQFTLDHEQSARWNIAEQSAGFHNGLSGAAGFEVWRIAPPDA